MGLRKRVKQSLILLVILSAVCNFTFSQNREKTFKKSDWKELTENADYSENIVERERTQTDNLSGFNTPKIISGVSVLQYLLFGLVIALLVFLIIRFLMNNYAGKRKLRKDNIIVENLEEEEVRPDRLREKLMNAIAEGNFKEAVRYYYLIIIMKLSEIQWIIWKKDKTNRNYLNEMRKYTDHFNEFLALTQIFEKVRYGNVEVNKHDFESISKKYDAFINEI